MRILLSLAVTAASVAAPLLAVANVYSCSTRTACVETRGDSRISRAEKSMAAQCAEADDGPMKGGEAGRWSKAPCATAGRVGSCTTSYSEGIEQKLVFYGPAPEGVSRPRQCAAVKGTWKEG